MQSQQSRIEMLEETLRRLSREWDEADVGNRYEIKQMILLAERRIREERWRARRQGQAED